MTFEENFYILNSHSYIKNIPTNLDKEFLKELKNQDGTLKPHVENIIENVFYWARTEFFKVTLPTLFIEITYKDSNKDTYFIEHSVFLYEEDYPNLKALEAYKDKFSYGFASQVTQEIKDVVEAFHNGYGCECLSSGDY